MKKLITKEFRQVILEELPGLENKEHYWKLLRRLIFGRKDELTGHTIIDASNLAITELGHEYGIAKYDSGHYVAEDFLKAFQRDVMTEDTFKWSDWSFTKHKARIAYTVFSDKLQEAIDKEKDIKQYGLKGLLYMDTGKKFSPTTIKIERDMKKERAIRNAIDSTVEQKVIINYLHFVNKKHFSQVLTNNLEAAYAKTSNIQVKTKRDYQLGLLSSIQEELVPLYQHSKNGNTVRIFPFNESILLLSKPIRQALCKGWSEFDLSSAQLAIICQCWNIPFIRNYLNSGNKIWSDLAIHMGLDPLDTEIKGILKDLLYSLIFGKTLKNLEKVIAALIGLDYVQLWLSHPVINVLLSAREVRMKDIITAKKLTTVFGKDVLITGTTKGKRDAEVRSALAQEAQALEFYLMQPIVDLALTTNDFVISLWLHDGCTIKFTDVTKQQHWTNKIIDVVNKRATSINIPTHLDVKVL